MKVWHLNHSDASGGAARAAFRIHEALVARGVDSTFQVNRATSGDPTVNVRGGRIASGLSLIRPQIGDILARLLRTESTILHSPAILPSFWPHRINQSDADIIHLQWIGREMMSVKDVGRINKPVIWTIHDMWPFCGAEHYAADNRFVEGYTRGNRPKFESGVDINRWTWNRKRRAWKSPMHIVAPSHWLADCVRQSALMKDWPVMVIYNAIDTDIWKPFDRRIARQLLQMPAGGRLVAFGAMEGGKDVRKGGDLLSKALRSLLGQYRDIKLVIFGERQPVDVPDIDVPIHYTGYLHDDLTLRILYSAVDAMVIPSRQDNLPNTGVEALACGTPVVAFDTGGLPDIVSHKRTGWLAKAFDTEELAEGIGWVLSDDERLTSLGESARKYAVENFSAPVVAAQYNALCEDVIRSGQE